MKQQKYICNRAKICKKELPFLDCDHRKPHIKKVCAIDANQHEIAEGDPGSECHVGQGDYKPGAWIVCADGLVRCVKVKENT